MVIRSSSVLGATYRTLRDLGDPLTSASGKALFAVVRLVWMFMTSSRCSGGPIRSGLHGDRRSWPYTRTPGLQRAQFLPSCQHTRKELSTQVHSRIFIICSGGVLGVSRRVTRCILIKPPGPKQTPHRVFEARTNSFHPTSFLSLPFPSPSVPSSSQSLLPWLFPSWSTIPRVSFVVASRALLSRSSIDILSPFPLCVQAWPSLDSS